MASAIRRLQSERDLEEVLELSEKVPVMLLKHSTRCAISSHAHQEFETYSEGAGERGVECALVLVVEDRALSGEIARVLDVRHQSPQAILVKDRRAVWHDSHEGVNAAGLEEAEGSGVAS
ncbi:MAG: bacillithiol system redox-active protein YtxJ [Planctomycetota bacterium]|nr:bacillithiol system redox-active protein YtxJ [Planctomycetota bacterium]